MVHFVAYGTIILHYGDCHLVIVTSQRLSANTIEVLAVKMKIFRDFMQLNELQVLESAFKS